MFAHYFQHHIVDEDEIPVSSTSSPIVATVHNISTFVFRKAVKATLILIPLLGLHWILTIYRPHPDGSAGSCHLTFIFNHLNVALDGCQGLAVALAFCYINSEVSLTNSLVCNAEYGSTKVLAFNKHNIQDNSNSACMPSTRNFGAGKMSETTFKNDRRV